MGKEKDYNEYYDKFLDSSWSSAGNNIRKKRQVLEQFSEKQSKAKKKLKGNSNAGEFFKNLKHMYEYLKSGDDLTIKAMIVGGLFYFISPIDLVPDFFPGIGLLDDIAVVTGIISSVGGTIIKELKRKKKL